jgi:hypothetical protein
MNRSLRSWLVLVALTAAITLLVDVAFGGHHDPPCTHGLSSIGPVELDAAGNVIGGDTVRTEACLP